MRFFKQFSLSMFGSKNKSSTTFTNIEGYNDIKETVRFKRRLVKVPGDY